MSQGWNEEVTDCCNVRHEWKGTSNLFSFLNRRFYYEGETGMVAMGIRKGELIAGLQVLGERLYVFTNERILQLLEKKRPWYNRLWRKIWK